MFVGETIEGEVISSIAEFMHNIPDAPVIISPLAGESVGREHVLIVWIGQEPIALNIDLTFEVPSTFTELRIPPEFLMPGEEYQYELMAVETGGNRTFTTGTSRQMEPGFSFDLSSGYAKEPLPSNENRDVVCQHRQTRQLIRAGLLKTESRYRVRLPVEIPKDEA